MAVFGIILNIILLCPEPFSRSFHYLFPHTTNKRYKLLCVCEFVALIPVLTRTQAHYYNKEYTYEDRRVYYKYDIIIYYILYYYILYMMRSGPEEE